MSDKNLDKVGSTFQKQSYKPPRLEDFGDVRHLTQAASQGSQVEHNGNPSWKVKP